MTDLRKPVSRRVRLPRGPVSVTLFPDGTIGFREHKARIVHRLPLARVFVWAVEATIEDRRRAKVAASKARRNT